MKKQALGKGLEALIPSAPPEPGTAQIREIYIEQIAVNPYQPRRGFDEDKLSEMVASIRSHGIMQPVIVRQQGGTYELVAGERRLRAARKAGLDAVPALIRDVSDRDMLALSLIENIQRADLNPVEEARAYRRLADDFGLTQEGIADAVGRDRSSVANTMRLLTLPDDILEAVSSGAVTRGHAMAMLPLPTAAAQRALLRRIVAQGLSVRETEAATHRASDDPASDKAASTTPADPHDDAIADRLRSVFGCPVRIKRRGKASGRVEIHFHSDDDLTRVLDILDVAL